MLLNMASNRKAPTSGKWKSFRLTSRVPVGKPVNIEPPVAANADEDAQFSPRRASRCLHATALALKKPSASIRKPAEHTLVKLRKQVQKLSFLYFGWPLCRCDYRKTLAGPLLALLNP